MSTRDVVHIVLSANTLLSKARRPRPSLPRLRSVIPWVLHGSAGSGRSERRTHHAHRRHRRQRAHRHVPGPAAGPGRPRGRSASAAAPVAATSTRPSGSRSRSGPIGEHEDPDGIFPRRVAGLGPDVVDRPGLLHARIGDRARRTAARRDRAPAALRFHLAVRAEPKVPITEDDGPPPFGEYGIQKDRSPGC